MAVSNEIVFVSWIIAANNLMQIVTNINSNIEREYNECIQSSQQNYPSGEYFINYILKSKYNGQ